MNFNGKNLWAVELDEVKSIMLINEAVEHCVFSGS